MSELSPNKLNPGHASRAQLAPRKKPLRLRNRWREAPYTRTGSSRSAGRLSGGSLAAPAKAKGWKESNQSNAIILPWIIVILALRLTYSPCSLIVRASCASFEVRMEELGSYIGYSAAVLALASGVNMPAKSASGIHCSMYIAEGPTSLCVSTTSAAVFKICIPWYPAQL